MEYLNGMLIIASAFSVFGQYIDTGHRHEIQCLKDSLEKLDFDDPDGDDGLNECKVEWDRLRIIEPLRTQFLIGVLAAYLVSLVIYFTAYHLGILFFSWPVEKSAYINNLATASAGVILVLISISMFVRVYKMASQKKKFKDKCKSLSVMLKVIRKSIHSRKK